MAMLVWTKIPEMPHFAAEGYIAIYKRTVRGLPLFWVFTSDTKARNMTERNALSVGGLPAGTHMLRQHNRPASK